MKTRKVTSLISIMSLAVAGVLGSWPSGQVVSASAQTPPVAITDPYYFEALVLDQGSCFEWMVLGVRGSGEPLEIDSGLGKTLKVVFDGLNSQPRFSGKIGSAYPKAYAALSVDDTLNIYAPEKAEAYWFQMAAMNTVHVNKAIRALAITCPSSKIILAGYSQGAVALSTSLAALKKGDPIRASIRGAYLVGNPAARSSKGFFSQAKILCSATNYAELLLLRSWVPIIGHGCLAQSELLTRILDVRTPASGGLLTVQSFSNKGDLFADRSWLGHYKNMTKAPVFAQFHLTALASSLAAGLQMHSEYSSSNSNFVADIRAFSKSIKG